MEGQNNLMTHEGGNRVRYRKYLVFSLENYHVSLRFDQAKEHSGTHDNTV